MVRSGIQNWAFNALNKCPRELFPRHDWIIRNVTYARPSGRLLHRSNVLPLSRRSCHHHTNHVSSLSQTPANSRLLLTFTRGDKLVQTDIHLHRFSDVWTATTRGNEKPDTLYDSIDDPMVAGKLLFQWVLSNQGKSKVEEDPVKGICTLFWIQSAVRNSI